MTNLTRSLSRIDPTEGLVQYAKEVKPYHSKILDVLVEYVYSEKVAVSMKERWSWKMMFDRPKVDTVYTCGYGLVWDPYKTSEASPPVDIISSQSLVSIPLIIRSTADDAVLVIPSSGHTISSGTIVTINTTGTLPASVPQVKVGVPYRVTGHNAHFTLTDPQTNQLIRFSTNGTGLITIEPSNVKFNSFLVEPNFGPSYDVAVINKKANQLAFVDSYDVIAVNPTNKQWTIDGDVRPHIPLADVVYDNVSLPSPAIPGNCNFVFDGNKESFFPAESVFTVISGANAGTYQVATTGSNRVLTRFDGKQTIVPVVNAIPHPHSPGTARTGLDTVIPVGSVIYVNSNTGVGGNGRYTVTQAATIGANTVLTVKETVSMLTANNGVISMVVHPSRVPAWPSGLLTSFSAAGAYPPPLTPLSRFYYVPTKMPGIFNLATKRYPTELGDYVDIADVSAGLINIRRAEVFNPGAYVKISGSYLSKNDGNYIIRNTVPEGNKVRVYVMEKVPFTTPQSQTLDGIMEFNFDSYDAPVYCPVSQCSDMHADTFIHERIMFEYTMHLNDAVCASITDQTPHYGFGSTPYGNNRAEYGLGIGSSSFYAITSSAGNAPVGTILPTGYDMQFFDLGGLDETVDSVARNYGKVV